jgi:hypothetical protein
MSSRRVAARYTIAMSIALLVVTACNSVTSRTSIDPGQAFRLGGGQLGAFTVRGSNSGAVPVVVFIDRNGARDSITTVAPGQKVDATFPARSMAVFVNRPMHKAHRSRCISRESCLHSPWVTKPIRSRESASACYQNKSTSSTRKPFPSATYAKS